MKWLGYREVAVKSITLDAADIRRRMKSPDVAMLAEGATEMGDDYIHPPTIRAADKLLICGRNRIAGAVLRKARKIWVHLCECTDEEAALLEKIENAHRRQDDRTALIAAIAKEREAYRRGTQPDASTQEIRTLANRDAAALTGVSIARVKNAKAAVAAEQRAAEAPAVADGDTAFAPGDTDQRAEPAPPCLDLLGVDDSNTRFVCGIAKDFQKAVDEADKHLRLALAALKPLESQPMGQRLRPQIERVGSLVRSERPAAICPWCKGLPIATTGARCAGCGGEFFVSAEKLERAPQELREQPLVAIDGKFYPYVDVAAGKLPPKNGHAKPTKRITAVDEAGNEIPLDADEAY